MAGRKAMLMIIVMGLAITSAIDAQEQAAEFIRSSIKTHCGQCHSGEDAAADQDLSTFCLEAPDWDLELLQSLIDVLELREMPHQESS